MSVEQWWNITDRGGKIQVSVQAIVFNDLVSFQDYMASVMNERVWNVGKTVPRRKRKVPGEKCVPVLHSSLQIPRDQPWDPTRASALRCRGQPF